MDIPPFPFLGRIVNSLRARGATISGLHMEDVGENLPVDNFAYLDHLWQTWAAPGHHGHEDLVAAKAALREPANQQAVLSLYRSVAGPEIYGTMDWVGDQLDVWGRLPLQPTLYLHGSHDGVVPMSAEMLIDLAAALPEGSQVETVDGSGHFTAVEKPDEVNAAILAFLAAETEQHHEEPSQGRADRAEGGVGEGVGVGGVQFRAVPDEREVLHQLPGQRGGRAQPGDQADLDRRVQRRR